jgi:hypothetical protein
MKLYKISCDHRDNFGLGLFSIASHVLTEFYDYENNRGPDDVFTLNVSNYDYGKIEEDYDIWDLYWEPVGISKIAAKEYKGNILDIRPYSIWGNYTYNNLEMYESHAWVAKKYFQLQPSIKHAVDDFVNENLSSKKTLAVHYRGTDKVIEAKRTAESTVVEKIKQLIQEENYNQVYICTDEEEAMQHLESSVAALGIPVIKSESFRATEPGHAIFSINRDNYMQDINTRSCRGVMAKGLTNYKKGYDVIFDVYTMAKCQGFVRCRSNVSDWTHLLSSSIQKSWFI